MTAADRPTERRPTTHIRVVAGGPIMVDGPVSIEMPDGSVVESDRFTVALCACKRSKNFPLCDTSHRRKKALPQRD
ncbi:MAG: CDGSH iron-sulfur domain-containing protein [Gordonia sp.]|jgi:hypothetical protein|uniref:CDGSH iron-sulfur domain-containing protein n=1 Tax=Gordonia rubripertincta TaxID=36822 RepID=A0ABT4N1P6_GORRU|nr:MULTISPECIES: CDGSH iron-sulfur domain-containing protein [Mycobacteriales]MBA4024392.1 CDGSH iron-sulfur domain-containing protein [Gordonia sp. (in: high G+C Gram-positive bacteria)]MCZ4553176.1 CDGSH iron-sulfur domain-containing protein [Gordonia rubripertincta]OZG27674.1 iron-binding protein [Williamsia sp. 1138]